MSRAATSDWQTRLTALGLVVVVIPLGLVARSFRAGAEPGTLIGFITRYAGDTLWPVMFFFLARCAFPQAHAKTLLVSVLLFTLSLEFGQLWQPDWLMWLRALPVTGFLLGNTFLWSDVVCLLVGSTSALVIDRRLGRRGGRC